MQKRKELVMDEKDEELIDKICSFGYTKAKAKCYLFFQNFEEAFSSDIERTMNERQPPVSIALNEMCHEGLLKSVQIYSAGKGRPRIKYIRKTQPFDYIRAEANKKIKEINENLLILNISFVSE